MRKIQVLDVPLSTVIVEKRLCLYIHSGDIAKTTILECHLGDITETYIVALLQL